MGSGMSEEEKKVKSTALYNEKTLTEALRIQPLTSLEQSNW
jgi:hypothetical protein